MFYSMRRQVTVASVNFRTPAIALTEAGLIGTLKGNGPFTVFTPTDEAFAKLPKADLDRLLDDKLAFTRVVLNQVVTVDIEPSNGVIHVIDSVIKPPAGTKMAPEGEKKSTRPSPQTNHQRKSS